MDPAATFRLLASYTDSISNFIGQLLAVGMFQLFHCSIAAFNFPKDSTKQGIWLLKNKYIERSLETKNHSALAHVYVS